MAQLASERLREGGPRGDPVTTIMCVPGVHKHEGITHHEHGVQAVLLIDEDVDNHDVLSTDDLDDTRERR